MSTLYDFDQISTVFVRKAAGYAAHRYRHFDVLGEDVAQEIYVWLYGDGKRKVEKWLDSRPQQTTRIYRSMLDVAIGYGETEKAAKVGYRVDDIYWYTPNSITALMPLVLDGTFVQENGHVGELITMVIDIRRALGTGDLYDYFMEHDEGDDNWHEYVQLLIDKLGGDRPHIGRRKPMSNAKAQAITSESS